MDDFTIMGDNRSESSSYQSLFADIVLGRMETYDAGKLNCWPFRKSTDERDGIPLRLGNLCGGYPFSLCGHIFPTSESAYLCGEFSLNTPIHAEIQHELQEQKNGFVSKKFIKNKYKEYIREDWEEIRLQWMLYVVWHKCIGNADFRDLLLSLPADSVIIENSNKVRGRVNGSNLDMVWGAKNDELKEFENHLRFKEKHAPFLKPEYLKKLEEERASIYYVGHFEGQNNMGKVLKLCQIALLNKVAPPIDYDLLRAKQIYLFGELLTFDKEEAL